MVNDKFPGVLLGRTLLQQKGSLGGARSVFVKMGGIKDELVFPPLGGQVKNPFKGRAKCFAGDLMEYRTSDTGMEPEIYLLKTYEVQSQSGTTVNIYRDGYHHKPFVGDILMKAPDEIGGTGASSAVTAVEVTTVDSTPVWALTVDSNLTGLADGDILVEATTADASSGTMVVQNINAVAPADYDFVYPLVADAAADDDYELARYFIVPAIAATMYKSKMSPIPDCCEPFNIANVNGWFGVDGRINRVR